MAVRYVTIDNNSHGQRIDNYLIKVLKGVPRSYIYRILRKGEVRVNKKRIAASYNLCDGDEVRIPPLRMSDPKNVTPSQEMRKRLMNSIIHEDESTLLLNKPSGFAVHGGSGLAYGVIEALRAMEEGWSTLELVHRIDRETSGCLLLAKTRSALLHYQEQFINKEAKKSYLALLVGRVPFQEEVVEVPLTKFTRQSGEYMVKPDPEGKEAETHFQLVEYYGDNSLVRCMPITGRTHQIRVHGQYLGFPLAGDSKYGKKDANKLLKKNGLTRLFLHAKSLDIPSLEGPPQHFKAPMPEDLTQALENIAACSREVPDE